MSASSRDLCLPRLVEQTLRAFVDGLRSRFGARLVSVRLFGSYARGEAHEESDADCLVLLRHIDPGDDRTVVDLAADLSWQIGGVLISPLVMTPEKFAQWKATERRVPLAIESEGLDL